MVVHESRRGVRRKDVGSGAAYRALVADPLAPAVVSRQLGYRVHAAGHLRAHVHRVDLRHEAERPKDALGLDRVMAHRVPLDDGGDDLIDPGGPASHDVRLGRVAATA